MSLLAMAQDTIPIPAAAGVNLGANRLDFPGSRQQFDSLLIRMHDSQQKLNILHIGGSHVQAGIFPNRLREHFDASRGLLFPWKAIRTNAPRDYSLIPSGTWERSRCIEALPMETLGMSGAAATTNDSLATLRLELPAKYSFAKSRRYSSAISPPRQGRHDSGRAARTGLPLHAARARLPVHDCILGYG